MAGVDPVDDVYIGGSVRSIDSVNVWPLLAGTNLSQVKSANFAGLVYRAASGLVPLSPYLVVRH
jgi:hypothetical protein